MGEEGCVMGVLVEMWRYWGGGWCGTVLFNRGVGDHGGVIYLLVGVVSTYTYRHCLHWEGVWPLLTVAMECL